MMNQCYQHQMITFNSPWVTFGLASTDPRTGWGSEGCPNLLVWDTAAELGKGGQSSKAWGFP